jgi:hypothetical protein
MFRLLLLTILLTGSILTLSSQVNCKTEIINLMKEQASLSGEKRVVQNQLKSGDYCSICYRTAIEIEATENISFRQHLQNVNGVAIPASCDVILSKARDYSQVLRDISLRINELKKNCPEFNNEQNKQVDYNNQYPIVDNSYNPTSLVDNTYHDESTTNDYKEDIEFTGTCCGQQKKIAGKITRECNPTNPSYCKYYIDLTQSYDFKSLEFYVHVSGTDYSEDKKIVIDLGIGGETYLCHANVKPEIRDYRLNCFPFHKDGEIDPQEYMLDDSLMKIKIETRYNEQFSDEEKNQTYYDRRIQLTNISPDTMRLLGNIQVYYDQKYGFFTGIDSYGSTTMPPGSTFNPCLNEWCFSLKVEGCPFPVPNYKNAVYYPVKTFIENRVITYTDSIAYSFPYKIIYRSTYAGKESFEDICFGMTYDVFILMPPNKDFKKIKWFTMDIKYYDECGAERSMLYSVHPFPLEQKICQTKKTPIRIEVK